MFRNYCTKTQKHFLFVDLCSNFGLSSVDSEIFGPKIAEKWNEKGYPSIFLWVHILKLEIRETYLLPLNYSQILYQEAKMCITKKHLLGISTISCLTIHNGQNLQILSKNYEVLFHSK